jgi:hypothetical protein
MRSILSILTIAALLLCPFDCIVKRSLARAASGLSEKTPPVVCCSDCAKQERRDDSTPTAPTKNPSQDDRCCICEGAILATVDHSTETFSCSVLTWVAFELPVTTCQPGFSAHPLEDGFAAAHLLGRERRISMLSLLL